MREKAKNDTAVKDQGQPRDGERGKKIASEAGRPETFFTRVQKPSTAEHTQKTWGEGRKEERTGGAGDVIHGSTSGKSPRRATTEGKSSSLWSRTEAFWAWDISRERWG